MLRFSAKVKRSLKSYVYAYSDPRTGKEFYIGHGKGDRAFDHLKQAGQSDKLETIAELERLNLKPTITILRHGLSSDEAKIVESVCIDLLGVDNLTNEVRGKYSRMYGKSSVEELRRRYDAPLAQVNEKCIAINISQTYMLGMSERELYECTRGIWPLGKARNEPEYALAVYEGVILEAYRIHQWFSAGSVYSERRHSPGERFEFVGNIDPEMSGRYKGKSLANLFVRGARFPVRYLNCGKQSSSL